MEKVYQINYGTIWQNVCGARERAEAVSIKRGTKPLYNDLNRRRSTLVDCDQIWKDINRTYRENIAFGGVNANPTNTITANNTNSVKSNKLKPKTLKKSQSNFFKYAIHDGSDD